MSSGSSLKVNGEERKYDNGCLPGTVLALIKELNLDAAMVVAEVNGVIVGRDSFADHVLRSGDTVELVRFVGGG